ncbi:MAG: PH domain-containing protein [Tannerellaceae bacterium]|nr:PH domain-containing protein [Tannerellaceae bacterium]
MEKKKVFRSRISVLVIGFTFIVFILVFISVFQEKSYQEGYILAGALLFIILLFTGTRYIISGDKLLVKIWFITSGTLNIPEIKSVERSYNPLSSPAASLKRLRISFVRGRYWLISPVREEEFFKELKAINPHIHIHVPEKRKRWRVQDWDI